MDAKYIAAAIPIFFMLMAVELLVNWRRGELRYHFADSITNLSCGVGQQVLGALLRGGPILLYALIYEHLRLFTIPTSSVAAWIAMLFLVDFCYFLFHWASHRVNFLWAAHVVHHQSEEYNLSVALRQAWFQQFFSFVFYLPLALLGFPLVMYLLMSTFNTLYQFWIHTRAIRTLGPLEWFLNTPSHHRVHHGIDPIYIDANYAGIFIIWDRLFRTFRPEVREPVYGTVKPLASWNLLWANLEHWVRMARMARETKRWRDKLRTPLMPPEWRPEDLGGNVTIPEVSRATQRKYETHASRGLITYVAVHFSLVAAGITAFLLYQGNLPTLVRLGFAALLLLSLVCFGALLEMRRWARPLEALRILGMLAAVLLWMPLRP